MVGVVARSPKSGSRPVVSPSVGSGLGVTKVVPRPSIVLKSLVVAGSVGSSSSTLASASSTSKSVAGGSVLGMAKAVPRTSPYRLKPGVSPVKSSSRGLG